MTLPQYLSPLPPHRRLRKSQPANPHPRLPAPARASYNPGLVHQWQGKSDMRAEPGEGAGFAQGGVVAGCEWGEGEEDEGGEGGGEFE